MNIFESKEKEEKINQFLRELTDLSNKHGIAISGCGCCGSPFFIIESAIQGCYVFDTESSQNCNGR